MLVLNPVDIIKSDPFKFFIIKSDEPKWLPSFFINSCRVQKKLGIHTLVFVIFYDLTSQWPLLFFFSCFFLYFSYGSIDTTKRSYSCWHNSNLSNHQVKRIYINQMSSYSFIRPPFFFPIILLFYLLDIHIFVLILTYIRINIVKLWQFIEYVCYIGVIKNLTSNPNF